MIIPVVLIPIFTFAFFILTWQGGLSMNVSKSLLPILFGLPVVISFIVIGIVVIVRLCRKLPVLLLVQVLAIEIIVTVTFFALDYQRSTWMMNQFLYQDKREEFVTRLKTNPNAGEEQAAMAFIDTSRNALHSIQLHDDEENLQNKFQAAGGAMEASSNVAVMRDCDGNLTVEFVYDGKWYSGNYVILYSERKPKPETREFSDSYGVKHNEFCQMIHEYKVIETISPNWYYAESMDPYNYLFRGVDDYGVNGDTLSGCP